MINLKQPSIFVSRDTLADVVLRGQGLLVLHQTSRTLISSTPGYLYKSQEKVSMETEKENSEHQVILAVGGWAVENGLTEFILSCSEY